MPATAKDAVAVRNILNPSPVRLNRIPNWFRQSLLKAFPATKKSVAGTSGPIVLDQIRRKLKLS
jgi:hypothetical protein